MGKKEVDCEICNRLWRSYAEATRVHIGLLAQEARFGGSDPAALKTFADQVDRAGMRRDAARSAVQRHQAEAHGRKTIGAGD